MKFIAILGTLILTLALGLPAVHAGSDKEMPPAQTTPEFDALKSLSGTWVGTMEEDGKPVPVEVRYKVTSGGTAIEETLSPGKPHEMVSVYFLDGNNVMMTHYCALGNQPRMKMTESKKAKKIKFEMVDATGMETPQDPHMGGLTVTLQGKDKLIQEWIFVGPDGKREQKTFSYQRKK